MPTPHAPHDDHHDHGDGLHEDLVRMASRRDALKLFGAGGAAAILAGLGAGSALAKTPTAIVPSETAGPYPGDGSNGIDVLDDSGIVRHDIRRSFGSSRTLATGVPLRVNLTVTRRSKDYAPVVGAAVYLWHADRLGNYSLYSSGITDENYLRGIAKTNSNGTAWFRTIYPGATTAAGRTSTSRSTRRSRRRPPTGRSSRPPRSRSRRRPASASTPPAATPRARRRCRGSRCPATTSSATTAPSTSSPPSPAASARGTSRT
ncbi:hypothetical protein [Conexibacter sp. W3-3-2]|uniref:dioxygenase family protein n=1 Tax=Conexibacter sp. W3-3-2 TaxID=2675227 RepID=UPI001E4E3FC0|nr:hypothetical protein [Conexibacter sp. W3-3-2]